MQMANRFFNSAFYSMVKNPVLLFARVTIGGTGACTLVASGSKGVSSITRTSAGLYVLTLQDVYVGLISCHAVRTLASGIPAAPGYSVVSNTVTTTKTITVQFSGATASGDTTLVATDPSSGTTLDFQIWLSNSSAP
jgi:hypothetical protein